MCTLQGPPSPYCYILRVMYIVAAKAPVLQPALSNFMASFMGAASHRAAHRPLVALHGAAVWHLSIADVGNTTTTACAARLSAAEGMRVGGSANLHARAGSQAHAPGHAHGCTGVVPAVGLAHPQCSVALAVVVQHARCLWRCSCAVGAVVT